MKRMLLAAFALFSIACLDRPRCETPLSSLCVGNELRICGTDHLSRPTTRCDSIRSLRSGERRHVCCTGRDGRDNCLLPENCMEASR